jgi:hypothetical protein
MQVEKYFDRPSLISFSGIKGITPLLDNPITNFFILTTTARSLPRLPQAGIPISNSLGALNDRL